MTSESTVVGVDRCHKRWIAAAVTFNQSGQARSLLWRLAPTFDDVVGDSGLASAQCFGVDIPIGLSDTSFRDADLEARRALASTARSRLFLTPPRPVLEQAADLTNSDIQTLCRTLTGHGVSRQALALADAIFDVERCLLANPQLQPRVWEVHPELSFAAMSEADVLPSKKTARGVVKRLTVLKRALSLDVTPALGEAPVGVPVDDCLDAIAAAWSAWRQLTGVATSYPGMPHPTDAKKLRMAIVT